MSAHHDSLSIGGRVRKLIWPTTVGTLFDAHQAVRAITVFREIHDVVNRGGGIEHKAKRVAETVRPNA